MSGEIDRVFAGLQTKLRNFKSEFGQEFQARVQARTPVITGRLQRGWGFTIRQNDVEIYNTAEYASYVEYGTPQFAPRGMLRATILEIDDITRVAMERAKR